MANLPFQSFEDFLRHDGSTADLTAVTTKNVTESVRVCADQGSGSVSVAKIVEPPLLWKIKRLVAGVSAVLLVGTALCGCQPDVAPKACPQIPVVDGFRTVVGEGGLVTLRLPEFAMIDLTQDCRQARGIELDYLWHDGKLISEGINRFKYPNEKQIVVKAYLGGFDRPLAEMNKLRPLWKFQPALPHKTYPLEMYPRAYWQDPAVRPEKAPPDVLWGVRGTRNPITQRPNTVACGIVQTDPKRQESVVDGEFGKFGDAKCRGSVYAVTGTKAVGGTVDVWAIGMPEIDKIHNAAQKQFETFIVRD